MRYVGDAGNACLEARKGASGDEASKFEVSSEGHATVSVTVVPVIGDGLIASSRSDAITMAIYLGIIQVVTSIQMQWYYTVVVLSSVCWIAGTLSVSRP
jgi:hypothetical protein